MTMFTRRKILTAALGSFAAYGAWRGRSLVLPASAGAPAQTALSTFSRTSRALGTEVSITIAHADAQIAAAAVAAAFAEIETVEQSLSIYRPDSSISQLNRDGVLPAADEHLLTVLDAALATARRTDGAFDVTVQRLWEAHAAAARDKHPASVDAIDTAREKVGWQHIRRVVDRVWFDRPGMAITFNGIAQGYATDRVMQVLKSYGIAHALINAGEFAALGEKSIGRPWQVGVQHPRRPQSVLAVAKLAGRCLSTSGDYETTFGAEAPNDHHIFDPATGHSPTEFASVSVVAPTAMEADALSTALFVMGLAKGKAFAEQTPGIDALFVLKDLSAVKTAGFASIEVS